MLTVYTTTPDGRIETADGFPHNALIVLVAPTPEEIRAVACAFRLDEAYLRDALDAEERPRVEKGETEDGRSLVALILGIPMENDAAKAAGRQLPYEAMPYRVMPFSLIHLKDHLIIVMPEEHPTLEAVLAGRFGPYATYMKTRITLLFFQAVASAFLRTLDALRADIARLQRELKAAHRNRELYGLIHINKSLVYFAAALRGLRTVYQRLLRGGDMHLYADDAQLLRDALVDIEQALEVTEMRAESLSSLMDAYAAIIHNNVNAVLKILTTLTIVLTIPTMIASVFAMNVGLPFEEAPWMFGLLLSLMTLSGTSLVVYFYRKNFLRL